MKKIAVFCGSSGGKNGLFRQQAHKLGVTMAQRGLELVYGGAKVGLMGAVADAVLSAGGKVTGILPDFLKDLEIAHDRLTELIIVESMHSRKTLMNELSDGVIALPGGFGTLEELFEMLTWAQLGLIRKPVALLNTAGYYDGLVDLIKNMVDKGFLKQVNYELLLIGNDIDSLLDLMYSYQPTKTGKWISGNEAPMDRV